MSKHTLGPWWVGDKKDGYMSRTQIEPSIAIAWGAINDEEADANANLIAAAPELMEALENMVNIAERVDSYESFPSNAIEKALDVIAKAKGKSCSTLCHPEEPCFITENGKCEAKGE